MKLYLLFMAAMVALVGLVAVAASAHAPKSQEIAIFAGGCFWCMEPEFKDIDGVQSVMVGYTGGTVVNPAYNQVSKGRTDHYEAIQVSYDPAKVSYRDLLDVFWRNVDPLDAQGQFCDKGSQYLSAIFYANDSQKQQAEDSKEAIADVLDDDVETVIKPVSPFYIAEDYHQEFYIKNYERYSEYKKACGREERLNELWSRGNNE